MVSNNKVVTKTKKFQKQNSCIIIRYNWLESTVSSFPLEVRYCPILTGNSVNFYFLLNNINKNNVAIILIFK